MNNISNKKHIQNDIFVMTSKIQDFYPEIYKNLGETPIFGLIDYNNVPDAELLDNYLETLNVLFVDFQNKSTNEK